MTGLTPLDAYQALSNEGQCRISRALGINRGRVEAILGGRYDAPGWQIRQLAEALGFTVEELRQLHKPHEDEDWQ